MIPNWIDLDEIHPLARPSIFRERLGIRPEEFTVLYAGPIGLVSGAEIVLAAAACLGVRSGFRFVFVGEGQLVPTLKQAASEGGLTHVDFLPFQPRELLNDVQSLGNVGLVTLRPGHGRMSVPSKVLGYLAAGRPVIAAVDIDSDTARLVRAANAGIVVAPSKGSDLAAALRELRSDERRRASMGDRGRAFMESMYAKPSVLHNYAMLLAPPSAAKIVGVRIAKLCDVDEIVSIHRTAFPHFFLTSLGVAFLRRFYGAIVRDEDGICLVSVGVNGLVGFAVGPRHPAKFFRKLLLRHGMWFAISAFSAVARRPIYVAARLLRAIAYRGEGLPALQDAALLSSIGVLPVVQGTGVARGLVDRFCEEAASRGARSVYLLTDREGNDRANEFYSKCGFEIVTTAVRARGRVMNLFVRPLTIGGDHT